MQDLSSLPIKGINDPWKPASRTAGNRRAYRFR